MNANYGDEARSNLRSLVAKIELKISELPDNKDPATGLRGSWDELVQMLALGPAPETRRCPVCDTIGMRAASRCGHCWASLAKEPAVVAETPRSEP